jgi:ABC-2 family transporter protein
MIRLAWRQFRWQALGTFAVLAVIAIVLAVTGPQLVHSYHTDEATCHGYGDCGTVMAQFVRQFHYLQGGLNVAVLLLPALIGIFWGAPLVARELETGTFRLAWTQTVTRHRWVITKLAVAGLTTLAVAGLLTLMVTWWSSPVDRVNLNQLTPAVFGERGLVPAGYAMFAFALGVLAGTLVRHTVPAMVVTLAGYLGARLAMTYWLRPRLFSPARTVTAFLLQNGNQAGPAGGPSGQADWVLSDQTINGTGQVIGSNGSIGTSGGVQFVSSHGTLTVVGVGSCPERGISAPGSGHPGHALNQSMLQACVNSLHIRELATYQPASRYWPLQWSELGIFLAAAVLAGAVCVWLVRRYA